MLEAIGKAFSRQHSWASVSTRAGAEAFAVGHALAAAGERVHDVVAAEDGAMALMPVCFDCTQPVEPELVRVADLPEDTVVTVRLFRFFEDFGDESQVWEKELRNVNSGSLLWLLVHTRPRMHSVSGSKYGTWFAAHYVRVRASHFRSAYCMCEEGRSVKAGTFGATPCISRLVNGEVLRTGYFWFSTPDHADSDAQHEDVSDAKSLELFGWQHLGREEPLSGAAFLAAWEEAGAEVEETLVQAALLNFA